MSGSIDYTSEVAVTSLFPSTFIDDLTLYLGLDPAVAAKYQPLDIENLLHTAISMTEQNQWRFILRKPVTLSLPLSALCFDDNRIYLPYGPVASLTTFSYTDTDLAVQNISSSDYTLFSEEPSWIWAKNWNTPIPGNSVHSSHPAPISLSYTTGYTDFEEIPKSTLGAIRVIAYHLFVNRGGDNMETPDAYTHLMHQAKLRNQRCMENM